MGRNYTDVTGQRFGRWVALRRETRVSPNGDVVGYWFCRCDCGTEKWVAAANLLKGKSQSCGCLLRYVLATHGLHGDPLYNTWNGIRQRVSNPKNKDYVGYGGRGIRMEPEWLSDFASFRSWVLEHIGPKPSNQHTIDRIDNDEGYTKGNLRWATRTVQQNNRRGSRLITRDGKTLTLIQWCRALGLNCAAVRRRVDALGWPMEVALTVPTDGTRRSGKLKKYQSESSHATA